MIETQVFGGCSSLTNLIIGKNVTSIGRASFSSSPIEICISYPTTPATIDKITFNSYYIDYDTAKLYVPKGSLTAYQASDWTTYFKNIIEM